MLKHPLQLDPSGALATIPDTSTEAATQLARAVLSIKQGECCLAPGYGLPDPLADGIDALTVAAAVAICEPDVEVTAVTVSDAGDGTIAIDIDVAWSRA